MPVPNPYKKGDRVQVISGIYDADYPEMLIAGWVGHIAETENEMCLIIWDRETLEQVPAYYRIRAERDGFEFGKMWLGETEIKNFSGGPVKIETPEPDKSIPLDLNCDDDRIRSIFKLTACDPLPVVSVENLSTYFYELDKKLRFPFEANWTCETMHGDKTTKVKVLSLNEVDDFYGILCTTDKGVGSVDNYLKCSMIEPNSMYPRKLAAFLS
ncbi:MAG: hypothetical protein ACKOX1_05990 [Ignavibacteria bacterium]